jgi:hypothetical protein
MQTARKLLCDQLLTDFVANGLLKLHGGSWTSHLEPLPIAVDGKAYRAYLSKQEISRAPIKSWVGPTHVVQSLREAQDVVEHVLGTCGESEVEEDRVLGFDIEFKPLFGPGESPPTVLQVRPSLLLAQVPSKDTDSTIE